MQDESTKQQESEYLSGKELAAKLGVSIKAVINWTQNGRLPVIKVGRLNRYPKAEINKKLMTGNLLYDKR